MTKSREISLDLRPKIGKDILPPPSISWFLEELCIASSQSTKKSLLKINLAGSFRCSGGLKTQTHLLLTDLGFSHLNYHIIQATHAHTYLLCVRLEFIYYFVVKLGKQQDVTMETRAAPWSKTAASDSHSGRTTEARANTSLNLQLTGDDLKGMLNNMKNEILLEHCCTTVHSLISCCKNPGGGRRFK